MHFYLMSNEDIYYYYFINLSQLDAYPYSGLNYMSSSGLVCFAVSLNQELIFISYFKKVVIPQPWQRD